MLTDIQTVVWKEFKEFLGQNEKRWTTITTVVGIPALMGLLIPMMTLFYESDWATWSLTPVIWMLLPFILMNSSVFDSFAGERERHTLATLLASRLPDLSILFGKIIMWALYAWSLAQLTMLVALVPASVLHGGPVFYPLATLIGGMLAGMLVAVLFTTLGVLISLRSVTVKQAQQRYSLTLALLFGVPVVLFILLALVFTDFAEKMLTPFLLTLVNAGNTRLAVLLGLAFLLLIDAILITLAMARFKRSQLLLD
jgi:ABC-2 type transport system permease protein